MGDLPDIILRRLFEEAAYGDGRISSFPFVSLSSPPFVLSHVCRLWRSIALAESSLWTRFRVFFEFQARGQQLNTHPSLLRLWLARSRGRNISFEANLLSDYKTGYRSIGPKVIMRFGQRAPVTRRIRLLVLLLGNQHRWEVVRLATEHIWTPEPIGGPLLLNDMPSLRSFELQDDDARFLNATPKFLFPEGLRRLSLSIQVDVRLSRQWTLAPMDNLTSLRFTRQSPFETYRAFEASLLLILRHTVNLEDFHFHGRVNPEVDHDPPDFRLLTLSRLHSLVIASGGRVTHAFPLRSLRLPALRYIYIDPMSQTVFDSVVQLLHRSSPLALAPLAHLELKVFENNEITPSAWTSLFQHAPYLEELHISDGRFSDMVVLPMLSADSSLCPNLGYIRYWGRSLRTLRKAQRTGEHTEVHEIVFAEAVKALWRAGTLKELRLHSEGAYIQTMDGEGYLGSFDDEGSMASINFDNEGYLPPMADREAIRQCIEEGLVVGQGHDGTNSCKCEGIRREFELELMD